MWHLLLHLLGHVEVVVGKIVQRGLDPLVDGGEFAEEAVPASHGLRSWAGEKINL